MKFAAFRVLVLFSLTITCDVSPKLFGAESCRCAKNPGPGGGVQCAKDQIATCDPSSGECNCTCDSVQRGKSKEEYESLILSKVLGTKVDPSELSSPQYHKFVSSFSEKRREEGTFYFDKVIGNGRTAKVKVGVPEWLDEVVSGKGGISIGPGASIRNCPNGICGDKPSNLEIKGNENMAGNVDQEGSNNTSQIGNDNTQITIGALTPAEREKRTEVENRITQLLNEGNDLMSKCFVAEEKPELEVLVADWTARTRNYLTGVRGSYAARFDAAVGLSFSYPLPGGKSVAEKNAHIIDFLKAKNSVLVKLLEEVSSGTLGVSQIAAD